MTKGNPVLIYLTNGLRHLASRTSRRTRQALVFVIRSRVAGSFVVSRAALAQLPGPEPIPLPHPEIAPPAVPPVPISWWLLAAGIIVALALVALIVWLLFRRTAEVAKETVSPLKQAIAKLTALQGELEALAPGEVAHRVSTILRGYLQARYAVPAPYRTTEELYSGSAIQAREGLRERFGPVAEFYDRLEFAARPATRADSAKLIEDALHVLRDEKRYAPGAMPPPLPPVPPSLPFVPTKL